MSFMKVYLHIEILVNRFLPVQMISLVKEATDIKNKYYRMVSII